MGRGVSGVRGRPQTQSQMQEKQTVIESNENDSGRNTLLFAGLATVLVLLGFYSLARR